MNGIKYDVRCCNEKFDYISELLLRLKECGAKKILCIALAQTSKDSEFS